MYTPSALLELTPTTSTIPRIPAWGFPHVECIRAGHVAVYIVLSLESPDPSPPNFSAMLPMKMYDWPEPLNGINVGLYNTR